VCNHPFLIDGAEENILKHLTDEKEINESLIKVSSKLLLVDKLLKKLRENHHKVLIFSQMVRVLNILEDYLQYRNYPYVRLDGTIRGDERQEAVDRFNNPNIDTFVFLVSTRAGGVGINLTAADTVIIFDSDWNPQNDIQAQARCHRIGQTKDVKVYRLLTKNTREKEMFERASKKLGLDRAVLNGSKELESFSMKESGATAGLDKEELDTLLKYGAYAAYKDDTEDEKMLVEGDIDNILERNSTVIRYDTQTSEEEANKQTEKGLLTFSKATFCFNESGEDVDINDKDFWTKMLPEQKDAEGLLRKLTEKDSLKAEKEIEQYFADLNVLVEENQREIKHLNFEGCDALANLLTQVIYSPKFDRDRVEVAKAWLEMVDKPRLRNQRHMEPDSEEDMDSDTYQEPTTEGKKVMQALGGWYKAERQRFQKAFLEFGWGKWDKIRAAKLGTHTVDDIRSFAENFVHVMRKKCSDDDKQSKNFLRSLILSNAVPEEDHDEHEHEDEEPTSSDMNESAKAEASSTLEKMDTTPDIDNKEHHSDVEMKDEGEHQHHNQVLKIVPDPLKNPKVEPGAKLLISIPKLQKGQLKNAHLEVILQRQNEGKDKPNMCVRYIELSQEDLHKGSTEIAAPGFPGKFSLRITGNNVTATSAAPIEVLDEAHPCINEKEYLDTIQRTVKTWVKKLHFLSNLYRVVGFDGEKDFKIPKANLKVPAPWWDEECDRHLLLGIIKHGYARFDAIRHDETLCIGKKYIKAIENAKKRRERKALRDSLPNIATVNKRAMKLVEMMIRDLEMPSSILSSSKSQEISTDLMDVSGTWSRREKLDLQRCLMNRGLYSQEKTGEPQWTQIAAQANLKKTNQQVKEMAESIIEHAKSLVAETEASNEHGEQKHIEKENDKGIELAPGTAQKLLSRIKIMQELAVNVFPNLKDFLNKLKSLTTSGHGLPKWWSHKDDMHLINGVKQYGFDFRKIFEDYPEDKKAPREGLLTKRLSVIAKLGGKVSKLGSPSPSKKSGQRSSTSNKIHKNSSSTPSGNKKIVTTQKSIREYAGKGGVHSKNNKSEETPERKGPRVAKKKASSKTSSSNGPRVETKSSGKKGSVKSSKGITSSKLSKSKNSTPKKSSTEKEKASSSSSTGKIIMAKRKYFKSSITDDTSSKANEENDSAIYLPPVKKFKQSTPDNKKEEHFQSTGNISERKKEEHIQSSEKIPEEKKADHMPSAGN
jgi:hypothetical protein